MGGDEFLVVLSDVHNIDEALAIADKIRFAAEEPIAVAEQELHTTLSIGVALAERGENLDRLLERADIAMYTAKRAGRNRVHAL
jgi:diguanylate cyclase (GGDEF)-like protein